MLSRQELRSLIYGLLGGLKRTAFEPARPGSRFAPMAFGFAPVLCSPAPGPCLGLDIGDEIVMTVEETESTPLMCDDNALGFFPGKQLRLRVDEQLENGNGERAYCSISTGGLRADTGWTYELSSEQPERFDSQQYATVVKASKGACVGSLDLSLRTENNEDLTTEPVPARISISFRTLQGGAECPASCRGGLVGPVALVR